MMNMNLETMLKTMSRGQILSQFEAELDKAITKKYQDEAATKAYTEAVSRINDDTYTEDDLVILQKRLNDKKKTEPAVARIKPKYATLEKKPDIEAKAIEVNELEDLLSILTGAKTTMDRDSRRTPKFDW